MWPEIRSRSATITAPHRRFSRVLDPQKADQPKLEPNRNRDEKGASPSRWSLFEGEPETCRRNLRTFLPILAHLGLLLGIYRVYRIEGRAFLTLVTIATLALPIHYALPFRWKKPFFIAISLLGMLSIFGAIVSAYVTAFSAVLIGICYLPIAWKYQAALVGGVALVCAWLRPEDVTSSIPSNVWPILATMFMFRMMIYLYELKHAKKPEPLIDTIGYFFLLPNYCFPHFPVVDYRTCQRGYFVKDVHAIQRSGLSMMFKGTIHLLLYRYIYFECLTTPDKVVGPLSLAGYLFCNYLLYLQVSGQFHVACGMLHLFGYQLPETHKHYLLATSFTDYWRRINIYWKDFMVRLVFNPVVFRLKRRPFSVSLACATAMVFVVTWVLHAYQSFWLRGTWGFSITDALFWGVLGAFVMINVQLDARRKPSTTKNANLDPWSPAVFLPRTAKTLATFTTITILWSLWSSPTLTAWLDMLSRGLLLKT